MIDNMKLLTIIPALLFIFLLFPISTSATSHPTALNAGVINGVWFSTASPEAGEEVRIFTAIQNQSTETISGSVAFLVNTKIVGSASFTVPRNNVLSVSIPYVFPGGDYDVSAYITSVENQNVAYTIVSETSVSVSHKTPEVQAFEPNFANASSTLAQASEEVLETGKDILDKIEPIAEATAVQIEEFRNEFLEESESSDTNSEISSSNTSIQAQEESNQETTLVDKFFQESKAILSTDGIPIWKKATGVLLSLLALIVRFWFIPLVLMILIILWALVRGRRIR